MILRVVVRLDKEGWFRVPKHFKNIYDLKQKNL